VAKSPKTSVQNIRSKTLAPLHRIYFSFIDCPLFTLQVNQSDLTQSEELLYKQINKVLDAMEHYYSLAEINLAIQETDSLLTLLKVADHRINETFMLEVSLEQLVMKEVFYLVVF